MRPETPHDDAQAPLPSPHSSVAHTLALAAGDPITTRAGKTLPPGRDDVDRFVAMVRSLLFPGFFESSPVEESAILDWTASRVEGVHTLLIEMLDCAFTWAAERSQPLQRSPSSGSRTPRANAAAVAGRFVERLPALRQMLALDVEAAYDGDPAAKHTDETVLCYPGVSAILSHRIAHALLRDGAPLLPRLIAEACHRDTAIDIHPGATIGESFFIDHGTGVVIGETADVGDHVKIYQGVTLGNKSFPKDEYGQCMRGIKRHPTICDRVTIYANAVVLGGDTVIGENSIISAGAIVAESIPPAQLVQQPRSELVLRPNREVMR